MWLEATQEGVVASSVKPHSHCVQGESHTERRKGMANDLCHFEFMANDVSRTQNFYSKVFDWKFEGGEGDYVMIRTGKDPDGGLMKKPAEAPAPSLQVYFRVDKIEDTLEKARGAGGSILVPKTPVSDMGWFAIFADPDGIAVGIWQSAKR